MQLIAEYECELKLKSQNLKSQTCFNQVENLLKLVRDSEF